MPFIRVKWIPSGKGMRPYNYSVENFTEDGKNKEVALSRPLAGNVRMDLNAWLTDVGEDTIPAQNEGRGVLMSVYGFFNEHFNIDNFDVVGTGD